MKLYNTCIKQLYICKPAGNSHLLNNMFVLNILIQKKLYENQIYHSFTPDSSLDYIL